jgi:hypothetical protein
MMGFSSLGSASAPGMMMRDGLTGGSLVEDHRDSSAGLGGSGGA